MRNGNHRYRDLRSPRSKEDVSGGPMPPGGGGDGWSQEGFSSGYPGGGHSFRGGYRGGGGSAAGGGSATTGSGGGMPLFQQPWKCIEKIPIDESAFPPNVKPAAIIIGVKGSNHTRMQDEAGCCVQLRGKGVSSPGTPGADEPIHLWVKYNTPDQLAKVREVLDEIIRSCEKGPPPELRKKQIPSGGPGGPAGPMQRGSRPGQHLGYGGPPLSRRSGPYGDASIGPFDFGEQLPPKPTKQPDTPAQCFFTLHYIAHAIRDLTTDDFEKKYFDFFGFPLDERLLQLGNGSFVAGLAKGPPCLRLEDVNTGQMYQMPLPVDQQVPPGNYYLRALLPMGMPEALFVKHIHQNQAASQQAQPPPPPPPGAIHPSQLPQLMPPLQVAHGGYGTSQPLMTNRQFGPEPTDLTFGSAAGEQLPSPVNLIVQALHALMRERLLQWARQPESELPAERVHQWPGIPISEIPDVFARELNIRLDTHTLGYDDVGAMIQRVAAPRILEVYWNPAAPSKGDSYVRFGHMGLQPDFTLVR